MTMAKQPCKSCRNIFDWTPTSELDHVHFVGQLPKARRSDSKVTRRGYAVGISGAVPQTWMFFADREPALAFGRAARMSIDITGYGVYEAADERRHVEGRGDIRTLHVNHVAIDREDGELDNLRQWVGGCEPGTNRYQPTKRTERNRT